jgi:AcrR family transcriptional regulator
MEYSEKQVKLIQAAEKLFADKGFDGTSVRDIAETAGVNLAMISYYFGSKEKLMEAMFLYRSEFFKLKLVSMIEDTQLNPVEKIEKLIDQYIEKLSGQQCFHRVMVREQMVNNNGFIANQIIQMKKRNQHLIEQLINDGQTKGFFKKDVDITLLMMTLTGTVSQMITTPHYYREANNLQDMPEDEFWAYIRGKLSLQMKKIFKAILTHED